jgi:hypothetical protein
LAAELIVEAASFSQDCVQNASAAIQLPSLDIDAFLGLFEQLAKHDAGDRLFR